MGLKSNGQSSSLKASFEIELGPLDFNIIFSLSLSLFSVSPFLSLFSLHSLPFLSVYSLLSDTMLKSNGPNSISKDAL